jgi:acetylornithine deacetylase/succinyl-diaminopimelate desuccinylase-like protein
VVAAVAAATEALGRPPRLSRWNFSTNGVASCGLFRVPTVGFGPGDEIWAHTPDDQVPVAQLAAAARFYALFPRRFAATVRR